MAHPRLRSDRPAWRSCGWSSALSGASLRNEGAAGERSELRVPGAPAVGSARATSVSREEQIADGDRLVAVWARATGPDATPEEAAVGAALATERSGLAGRALVDGDRAW